MEPRGMKRKRYAELKEELSVELHKLTNASGDLNNDFHNANREFEAMFKSIAEKQSEFLSRYVVLEEQYRESIEVLKGGGTQARTGQNTVENVALPQGYVEDVRKFAADVKTSLIGHGEFLNEENEEMEKLFKKYEQICTDNLKEMRMRTTMIAEQRAELSKKLSQFIGIIEESDSEEDEDNLKEEDDSDDED